MDNFGDVMKSNLVVKLVAVLLVLAGFFVVFTKVNNTDQVASDVPTVGGEEIDEATRTALGIEADTPVDTVKTLIQNVREQKLNTKRLQMENAELREANERILKMEQKITQKLSADIQSRTSEIQTDNAVTLANTKQEMQSLLERIKANAAEYTANKTFESQPPAVGFSHPGATVDSEGTVWVPPLGVSLDSKTDGLLNGKGLANLPFSGAADLVAAQGQGKNRNKKSTERPAYTIAKNSTLVGATAFTALVGRVPVGDNVVDPYSFKVLIGKENLIANGKKVPELAYAVVSGKAVGDWTLSCVQGDVYSITFVFDDGRIRTLPTPADISDGSTATQNVKIGELSDDFGNPCVVGEKISNASKYLYQRVVASLASAAANAAAATETTTTSSVDGYGLGTGTTVVDGNKKKYVLNETVAGAADEAAQWIKDRQALEFDAVYVRPGAKVAIHITEELRIDYDDAGRFTHHAEFSLGGKYRELD